MSEQEQRRIFSKNLTILLEEHDKTQREVADAISVSPQTFNTWVKGIALPRMGKVQALADYFNIPKSALIEEQPENDGHYVDPDTIALAQELYQNPEMHMLFDAVRTSSASDLKNFYDMIMLMKRRENPDG